VFYNSGMGTGQDDRLSGKAYEQALSSLYSDLARQGRRVSAEEVRRAEFDLLIAHKLGKSFSNEKRQSLWAVQQSLQKKMGGSMAGFVLRAIAPNRYARRLQQFIDEAVTEYKKILTGDELEALFDMKEGETGIFLPIDPGQLK